MIHLLNLLAAIALLVWSTHLVRTGMLRVAGENLRNILGKSFSNRLSALAAGWGVTSLVQSATATCLIVASFVGKGLVAAGPALAVMLGADVGSAMMAVVFSFDLSWLSPLLIFAGVVMFTTRQDTSVGRIGRVLIGLGLITLALQLIVEATTPLTQSPAVRTLLASLPNEVLLDIVVGATLTVLSYSSLAIVLLTATLAASGIVPVTVALGLVLGANLGSGFLALLATGGASPQVRRLPLGNLIFKALGAALAIPLLPQAHVWLQLSGGAVHEQVVWFHLGFNLLLALLFISFTGVVGRIVERVLPELDFRQHFDERRFLIHRHVVLTRQFENGWSADIKYSYNQARIRDNKQAPYTLAEYNRPHAASIGSVWEINPRWTLSARWKWASGKPSDDYLIHANVLGDSESLRYSRETLKNNTGRYSGYSSLNFRADYRYRIGRTDLIAFIDIINLLAAENPSNPEFNERSGKNEVEEGEAFPLLGLRFEW